MMISDGIWEDYTGPEDIQVGNRFSHPSWGDPSYKNSIIAEVTRVGNNKFWWKLIQPNEQLPYLVGSFSCIDGLDWKVMRVAYKYDPTQQGDKDDDI